MTTEHQTTQQEMAYEQLLEERWEMLSEAARTLLLEAHSASYRKNMAHNISYQPEEYEEAMQKMHLASAEFTGRDFEMLAELVRGAMAAAASLDQYDYETLAGYRVYRVNLHWYYRMLFGMVDEILQEIKIAELQEIVASEPVDDSDPPF